MNQSAEKIYQVAEKRRRELALSYAGALTPPESAALLTAAADAVLVDVRTLPELVYVGRVPTAAAVEWQQYPDMTINPEFYSAITASRQPRFTDAFYLSQRRAVALRRRRRRRRRLYAGIQHPAGI